MLYAELVGGYGDGNVVTLSTPKSRIRVRIPLVKEGEYADMVSEYYLLTEIKPDYYIYLIMQEADNPA